MTLEEQKDFLIKLKEEINNSKEFVFVCPSKKYIENYIWVGTPGGLIGTAECHYEIRFEGDTLYVEAHFEDDNFEDFRDIERIDDKLMYDDWEDRKDGRIVYRDKKGITGIAGTVNKGPKIKEVMDMLREFDGLIGEKLKRIV